MSEHVAHVGEKRTAYRALLGQHEEKRRLGRPRRRWEDNIKKYIKNRMRSRLGGSEKRKAAGRGNEPWAAIKFWGFID
jgi:hypothetical protein